MLHGGDVNDSTLLMFPPLIYMSTIILEEFVQLSQVFGLHRLKLHRYLVYGAVKFVCFRQVFGLERFRCIVLLLVKLFIKRYV
jgi:hypothetical protein